MKKQLVYLIIASALVILSSLSPKAHIRNAVHQTEISEELLEKLIESDSYGNSTVTKAYKGMCEMRMAEYCYLPTSKLTYFNKGKDRIDAAVKASPRNAELRYIRLIIQLNAPSFLGYNENITKDLSVFKSTLKPATIPNEWKKTFVDNLMQSEQISTAQKKELSNLKATL